MKSFLSLLLLIIFVACQGSPDPTPIPQSAPPSVEVVITSGKKPYLTVKKCTNCSAEEWKFIQESVIKTNETVETTCFSAFMLKRKLIQTLGRTNQEVLDSLLNADISIDTEMYYSIKKVLGYTLGNQPIGQFKEWINRRYMMSWNKCDLASLLGHETSHKIGYDHDYYYSDARNYSVPYSINEAFDACCVK